MKKYLLLSAITLAGCAPTAQLHLSSGRIGCPTSDIVVGDVDSTSHSETWSATCRGVTYFCSATDEFREVICKPQLKVPAVAPVPPPAPVVVAPPPSVEVAPAAEPAPAPEAAPVEAAPAAP